MTESLKRNESSKINLLIIHLLIVIYTIIRTLLNAVLALPMKVMVTILLRNRVTCIHQFIKKKTSSLIINIKYR